jgi:hypothetical protein
MFKPARVDLSLFRLVAMENIYRAQSLAEL